MQPYNVEIFDRDFNFIHNYTIESIDYQEDYLTLPETVVFMSYNENVKRGNYITVFNDLERYNGVITSVTASAKYDGFMNVGFKSFISLFRASLALYVKNVTSSSSRSPLENVIYSLLKLLYISGFIIDVEYPDPEMIIPGLSLSIISETYNWNIGLYSQMSDDYDGYQKVSVIDDLIIPAMKLYNIGCYADFDFKNKTISVTIGKKTNTVLTIETDLPNILNVNMSQKNTAEDVNSVDVLPLNNDEAVDPVIYSGPFFKHYDGSWSRSSTDRILPPIYDQLYYTLEESDGKRDQDISQMLVASYGGSEENNNLIEIVVKNDDPLATSFTLGDEADIIINDTVYRSIYTGKTKKKTTTLIFGTQRIDLTKQLIRRI